ncbi:hypothetical protein ACFLQV_00785 [Calditrichota bacterium]
MKLRSFLLVSFVLAVLLAGAVFFAWHVLGVKRLARDILTNNLKQQVNQSFEIGSIGVTPSGLYFHDVALDVSPQVSVKVRTVRLNAPISRIIFSGFDLAGSIEEVEIIEPEISISPSEFSEKDSKWRYRSYPLKPLAQLSLVRQISIQRGTVVYGVSHQNIVEGLNGFLDLTDPTHANLNLTGIISVLPDNTVEINGNADLGTGGFLISVSARTEDLSEFERDILPREIQISSGELSLNAELRGANDLVLTGKIDIDEVAGQFNGVSIQNGKVAARIFGTSLTANGRMEVNGLILPFDYISRNIFGKDWTANIPKTELSLNDLRVSGTMPSLNGEIWLDAKIINSNQGIKLQGDLNSDVVSVKGIDVNDLSIQVTYEDDQLRVSDLSGSIFGGMLDGSLNWSSQDGLNLKYIYRNSDLPADRFGDYLDDNLGVILSGEVAYEGDTWSGKGNGRIFDQDNRILLSSSLNLEDNSAVVRIRTPLNRGWLNFSLFGVDENYRWRMTSGQPQFLFGAISGDRRTPEWLERFRISANASGSSGSSILRMGWTEVKEDGLEGSLSLNLTKFEGLASLAGKIALESRSDRNLTGDFSVELTPDSILTAELKVNRALGGNLMSGSLIYNGAEQCIDSVELKSKDFPTTELLEYIFTDLNRDFRLPLNIKAQGTRESIEWSVSSTPLYSDGTEFEISTSGTVAGSVVSVDTLRIHDKDSGDHILAAHGDYDGASGSLDSGILSMTDFPIQRIFELATNEISPYGGVANARVAISGDVTMPDLKVQLQVNNGLLNKRTGYWVNVQGAGVDGNYNLEEFNVGRGIAKLLSLKGNYDFEDRAYELSMNGSDVELNDLISLTTSSNIPLSGIADFGVTVSYTDSIEQSAGWLRAGTAAMDVIEIDTIVADYRVAGLSNGTPKIEIGDLHLGFNSADLHVTGQIGIIKGSDLSIDAELTGELPSLLPRIDDYFSRPYGDGEARLKVRGSLWEPEVSFGEFTLRDAGFRMNEVVKRIDDLNIDITADADGKVSIDNISGKAEEGHFWFQNRRATADEENLVIGEFDLGVIQFRTDQNGIWAVIPSLMRNDWGGYLAFSGQDATEWFEFAGPAASPSGIGDIRIANATLTYPFLHGSGHPPSPFVRGLLDVLERMRWDANVIPVKSCNYSREMSGLGEMPVLDVMKSSLASEYFDLDIKFYVDLEIEDEAEGLHFTGVVKDTFRVEGDLISTRGFIEYLDLKFTVQDLRVEFTPATTMPLFSGYASTQVVDSLGSTTEIRLSIRNSSLSSQFDEKDLPLLLDEKAGGWDQVVLVLEDDQGRSQEQILALLGYSPEEMQDKFSEISGKLATNVTPLRRWQRSLERQAERLLGVDVISIQSPLTANLIDLGLSPLGSDRNEEYLGSGYLRTLDRSRVTIGKYLSRDVFLQYSGLFVSSTDLYNSYQFGFIHDWEMIYRLRQVAPNLSLNYRFRYDTIAEQTSGTVLQNFSRNSSLFIRYSVNFSLGSL